MQYSWPGNVRELYNLVERSMILHKGTGLLTVILDATPDGTSHKNQISTARANKQSYSSLAEFEKSYIEQVLQHCQGVIAGKKGAAHILDLPPSTLRSKMKKLGITS